MSVDSSFFEALLEKESRWSDEPSSQICQYFQCSWFSLSWKKKLSNLCIRKMCRTISPLSCPSDECSNIYWKSIWSQELYLLAYFLCFSYQYTIYRLPDRLREYWRVASNMERCIEFIAMSRYLSRPYSMDTCISSWEDESRRIAIMIGHRPDALIFWIKILDLSYDMSIVIFPVRICRMKVEIRRHRKPSNRVDTMSISAFFQVYFLIHKIPNLKILWSKNIA